MLVDTQLEESKGRLVLSYTAASPAAKYSIKRGQIMSTDHPIYAAWDREGEVVSCLAKLPFASGKGWDVDFDAVYFRSKIFAFFNTSSPLDKDQLRLL